MSDDAPLSQATAQTAPPAAPPATPPARRRRPLRRILMLSVPVLLILAAAFAVLRGGRYQSTDNANLHFARLLIAADQSGRVTQSQVTDGAAVAKGDLLFTVDPAPLRIAEAQAEAAVAAARLKVQGLQAGWRAALARRDLAQSDLDYRTSETARQQSLTRRGVASTTSLQDAQHTQEQAKQALASAEIGVQDALASLGNQPEAPVDDHPLVREAMAARDRAALSLSQAEVRAPAAGIVTQAPSFRAGQFVSAGTPVFSLIVTADTWVDANFKETQLADIRPGDSATVTFDAFPGRSFDAVVDAIAPGTGAEFALLPAQNATGNWVKVTQRVPVRLRLAEGQDTSALVSGLSADVEIDTRHPTRMQELRGRVDEAIGRNGAAESAPQPVPQPVQQAAPQAAPQTQTP